MLGLMDFAQDPLLAHGNIYSQQATLLAVVICCNVVLTLSVVAAHHLSSNSLVYLACWLVGLLAFRQCPPLSFKDQTGVDWKDTFSHSGRCRLQRRRPEVAPTTDNFTRGTCWYGMTLFVRSRVKLSFVMTQSEQVANSHKYC